MLVLFLERTGAGMRCPRGGAAADHPRRSPATPETSSTVLLARVLARSRGREANSPTRTSPAGAQTKTTTHFSDLFFA